MSLQLLNAPQDCQSSRSIMSHHNTLVVQVSSRTAGSGSPAVPAAGDRLQSVHAEVPLSAGQRICRARAEDPREGGSCTLVTLLRG